MNGPAIAQWLSQHDLTWVSESDRRRIREWANGAEASERIVDRICCQIDVHLNEIPAHVWLGWPERACEGLEYDPDRRVLYRTG